MIDISSLKFEYLVYAGAPLLTSFMSMFTMVMIILSPSVKSRGIQIRFLLYLLALFVWGSSVFIQAVSKDESVAYFFSKTLHFGAAFIPIFLLSFTTVYFRKRNFFDWIELLIAYALTFYFVSFLFFEPHLFISGVFPKRAFAYFPSPGPIYFPWMMLFFYCVISAHVKAFKVYLKSKSPEKGRYGVFLYTNTIAYASCLAYFFPVHDIYIFPYPWGAYGASVLTIIFAVSIARNDLMSPALIVKKGLLYSLILGSFTAIYVLAFVQLRQLLDKHYEAQTSIIGTTYLIVILVLIAEPFRLYAQRMMETHFFKGTIEKVHEQKEHLESELERTHRLKSVGILAAGMAHEIRNPIQSLRTFGEHLEQRHNDPEFRAKFEKLLIQETDRIKNLTSDLLDFSKPKEPKKMKTNLNDLILQTLSLVESDLMGEMIKVEINLPKEHLYKEVDPEQIKQALLNLILNAKDAMKQSKEKMLTISLRLGSESQKIGDRLLFSKNHENRSLSPIFISIQDTGCGIAEDKIPHLFDPFYTDKKEGTGLGLAITHSIIERHGWQIEVESKINEGTNFIVFFN